MKQNEDVLHGQEVYLTLSPRNLAALFFQYYDKNSNTYSFSFSFLYQFRLEVQDTRLFWVSLIQKTIEIDGPYVKNFCFDYTKLVDRGYCRIANNGKLYFLSQ